MGATVILSGPSGSPITSVPSRNSKLKLRLTKAQSALLEQAFKHHSTLIPVVLGFRDYIDDCYAAHEQHKLETMFEDEAYVIRHVMNAFLKLVTTMRSGNMFLFIGLQNLVTELCERPERLLQWPMEEDVKPIFPY
ncbi:hypothetical protein Tco_0483595 [Tanacetum coccineum]